MARTFESDLFKTNFLLVARSTVTSWKQGRCIYVLQNASKFQAHAIKEGKTNITNWMESYIAPRAPVVWRQHLKENINKLASTERLYKKSHK